MIFAVDRKLEVGGIYGGAEIVDQFGRYVGDQRFFVVREATEQEWRDAILAVGERPVRGPHNNYFYEISTD